MSSAAMRPMPGIQEDSAAKLSDRPGSMSLHSMKWDVDQKGFLTPGERQAKEADRDGKGYLNSDEARALGSRVNDLTTQNKQIRKILYFMILLVVLLCVATITSTILAIEANRETLVNEQGQLVAVEGGAEVVVKSQGLKISTYTAEGNNSTRVCISGKDLALAWIENENGGTATIVIEAPSGNEQVKRLSSADSRITADSVSFGDVQLFPDEECNPNAGSTPGTRHLKEHIRSLREWQEETRNLQFIIDDFGDDSTAFSFGDNDLC